MFGCAQGKTVTPRVHSSVTVADADYTVHTLQSGSCWVSHLPCSHDLSHPKYMTEMSISVPSKINMGHDDAFHIIDWTVLSGCP